MRTKFVTHKDIYDLLPFLPDENMNPTGENGQCIYTDTEGNHCIAGQIFSMLGFDLPDVEDEIANDLGVLDLIDYMNYHDYFSDEAVMVLDTGQRSADKNTHNGDPFAWAIAKRNMSLDCRRIMKEYGDE